MTAAYREFLASKRIERPESGREPAAIHESLYPFQRAIVEWAVRRGRAAVFADCGLGKTFIQLEWVRQMGRSSLIVAPLCVADQTIKEARRLSLEVTYCTEPTGKPGVWITNYERLKNFIGEPLDAIVLDESSILKSVDGKTRTMLLREFTSIPYRLCCTATPAPNDIAELANHAEFVGVLSRPEMLATFFVNDANSSARSGWRLKGHARDVFWEWVATWALYLRRPSDLGFDDGRFELPPLSIESLTVESSYVPDGMLFPVGGLQGIRGRSEARRQTMDERVEACADLIETHPGQWLVWCGLNDEGRRLAARLGSVAVLIEGSDSEAVRIERHEKWRQGAARVLISKPSIFGWGMNWQHCSQMAFLGLGDSYEQYYQAIRRCWRFGQERPVAVWIVSSTAEVEIVANVRRKESEAAEVAASIIDTMRDAEIRAVREASREADEYEPTVPMVLPAFLGGP